MHFLEPDNARMFGSIRSVTASACASLEYIQAQRTTAFSVREWVRSGRGGRGVLFIPYKAGQITTLHTVIPKPARWRCWLRESTSRYPFL
jgi:Type IV secretion-system coupling protein DNA-binding domain